MKVGSPPQVRGKLDVIACVDYFHRITPAGAGKTDYTSTVSARVQDHPRRCGENFRNNPVAENIPGSPPQVRGKHSYMCCGGIRDRITPAGAGKTNPRLYHRYTAPDHPRRCGENSIRTLHHESCRGSPPQVRGKLISIAHASGAKRITPAGAGKTALP